MSITFNKIGNPIAKVVNKNNKIKEKFIYHDLKDKNGLLEYIANENEEIVTLPYILDSDQRFSCLIAGKSGSGKSYHAAFLIKEIRKLENWQKAGVIFISASESQDKAFNDFYLEQMIETEKNPNNPKHVFVQLPINQELFDYPIDFFAGSIVVMDDWESLTDDRVVKMLLKLQSILLKRGRKKKIAMIIANHVLLDGYNTKVALLECEQICMFPSGGKPVILNYCETYHKLKSKKLAELEKDLRGERIFTIRNSSPCFFATSKKIWLI